MEPSRRWTFLILPFVLAAGLISTNGSATPLSETVRQEIAARLTGDVDPPVVWLGGAVRLDEAALPEFYFRRQYAPAWVGDFGLTAAAEVLLAALRDSSSHGLCSDDFRLPLIEPLVQLERDYLEHGVLFDPHYLAILDLLLTDAFFRYALELSGSRTDSPSDDKLDRVSRRLVAALQDHLTAKSLDDFLAKLGPQQEEYLRLRQALSDLRELSAFGGWPQIPAGPPLREGSQGDRVRVLKIRLFLGGDLEGAEAWDEPGIGDLASAGIRSFQERHGLKADGVVGPLTLAELNVPIEERIRQVEVNLMRWREAPIEFAPRHLRVNIADFTLEVHEQGDIVMSMPVVVGTPYRKTPAFSAELSYLEFSPFWHVPATILREDKLPLIRRDPGWLERNHYEIVSWREGDSRRINPLLIDWAAIGSDNFPGSLRMRPGPWNPLGRVKFMFPNRYAVYLHDTNERHLFARDERFYSSGCIRIERPLDLAQYLLDGVDQWDCELLVSALQGSETMKVYLPKKIPVHLLYWTAWVDDHQRLQFRRDIYLRDADIEVARTRNQDWLPARGAEALVRADLSASETRQ